VNSFVLCGLQGSCGSVDTIPLILNPIFARVSHCTIYLTIVLVLAVGPHPSQLSHRFKPGPPERSALRTQTSDTNYTAAGRLGTCKHGQPLFPVSAEIHFFSSLYVKGILWKCKFLRLVQQIFLFTDVLKNQLRKPDRKKTQTLLHNSTDVGLEMEVEKTK
jgi:hypothetical protein